MTRRRGTLIAVAAVAAVLITVGLGARRGGSESYSGDPCEEDLDELFEGCAKGPFQCLDVPEEFSDACEAACITSLCPNQVLASEQNQIWRASCSDTHGARFWFDLGQGKAACENKLHFGSVKMDWAVFRACWDAEVETRCPELAGTNWRAEFEAAVNK